MKIYIAGKITGDKNYKTKFKRAEKLLRSLGHSVMNPAWIAPSDDFTWIDYMQISRMMQARCNAVYFLKGFGSMLMARRSPAIARVVSVSFPASSGIRW